MLGNLDNEVIFKKAFTNKFVLQCLAKDLFNIDFVPETVETEKRFQPKIAFIDFKYDVFAQSKDKRIIVEIQRVDYDYSFDRFLLYHNMAIAEMQRSSKEYKTDKTVYPIAFFTNKYNALNGKGISVERDILLHNTNLFDVEGKEYDVFGHKLIFLNHNYLQNTTPQGYKDWLNLIKESIGNPENPILNLSNQGIRKVAELIDYEQLDPEERRLSKNRHAAESAKAAYKAYLEWETNTKIAKKLKEKQIDITIIAETTGLSIEQINDL